MTRSWTFGQMIAGGFLLTVTLSMVVAAVSIHALRRVVETKDRVITINAQNLVDAGQLESAIELQSAAARGFLLALDERHLESLRAAQDEFSRILARLKERVDAVEGRSLLARVEQAEAAYRSAVEQSVAARRRGADIDAVVGVFKAEVQPRRDALKAPVLDYVALEQRLLEARTRASGEAASAAVRLVIVMAAATLLASAGLAFLLTRTLTRQVGSAVQRVQSSSTELQAAANQQASGSREQATATSEVTTTIKELLSTSRQIAESTQRVARMAEETSSAARAGELTVEKGRDAVQSIRQQVDAIVAHMLDLGKRSHQIGSILEIINEMAEQTNILAINATIESAGAGEAGKRFAVVADEIRSLADRVGRSTKEIRSLIEETRAAANTTVMATEDGSKAVEAGTRQFGEVATTFQQIKTLVETTMEAAREIELGTRQQSTAVEQVSLAIASVAQASKETEASARQTLDTSSELARLSKDLARIIQAAEGA